MPRKEINYQNTFIYKIVCNDLNIKDLYVGHTTDFKRRKWDHKCCAQGNTKYSKLKIYQTIKENGGWDNWSMIEIEKFPCNDSKEACAQERFWFESLQANLNSCYPQRTRDEYSAQDHIKSKTKEFNKTYYLKNNDKIKTMNKIYRENNIDRIKTIDNQILLCECGKTYTRRHKARHQKTNIHIQFIEQQNN